MNHLEELPRETGRRKSTTELLFERVLDQSSTILLSETLLKNNVKGKTGRRSLDSLDHRRSRSLPHVLEPLKLRSTHDDRRSSFANDEDAHDSKYGSKLHNDIWRAKMPTRDVDFGLAEKLLLADEDLDPPVLSHAPKRCASLEPLKPLHGHKPHSQVGSHKAWDIKSSDRDKASSCSESSSHCDDEDKHSSGRSRSTETSEEVLACVGSPTSVAALQSHVKEQPTKHTAHMESKTWHAGAKHVNVSDRHGNGVESVEGTAAGAAAGAGAGMGTKHPHKREHKAHAEHNSIGSGANEDGNHDTGVGAKFEVVSDAGTETDTDIKADADAADRRVHWVKILYMAMAQTTFNAIANNQAKLVATKANLLFKCLLSKKELPLVKFIHVWRRRRATRLIHTFLEDVKHRKLMRPTSGLAYMAIYLRKIRIAQKRVRGFLKIKKARVQAMCNVWDKLEDDYIRALIASTRTSKGLTGAVIGGGAAVDMGHTSGHDNKATSAAASSSAAAAGVTPEAAAFAAEARAESHEYVPQTAKEYALEKRWNQTDMKITSLLMLRSMNTKEILEQEILNMFKLPVAMRDAFVCKLITKAFLDAMMRERETVAAQLERIRGAQLYNVSDAKALVTADGYLGAEENELLDRMNYRLYISRMNDQAALAAVQFLRIGDEAAKERGQYKIPTTVSTFHRRQFMFYREMQRHRSAVLAFLKEQHAERRTFPQLESLLSRLRQATEGGPCSTAVNQMASCMSSIQLGHRSKHSQSHY